jgi:hypothetical protein
MNIYVRVPAYVAVWLRNLDVRTPLAPDQPVRFSPYSEPGWTLSTWLAPEKGQPDHINCFSERMWRNMLAGKSPGGGRKVVLQRDPARWLSADEVALLNTVVINNKYEAFDYICVEIPPVVAIGSQYRRTDDTYSLSSPAASEMARSLRRLFIYRLLLWIRGEMTYCVQTGIPLRDVGACIDHFFAHYNIVTAENPLLSGESLRRMAFRWLAEAKMLTAEIEHDENARQIYAEKLGDREDLKTFDDMLNELTTAVK